MATPIDLTGLSMKQVRERLGELVEMSLRKSRMAVVVVREDGVLTLMDPAVFTPRPGMATSVIEALVAADWSDEQVEEFMIHLERL